MSESFVVLFVVISIVFWVVIYQHHKALPIVKAKVRVAFSIMVGLFVAMNAIMVMYLITKYCIH